VVLQRPGSYSRPADIPTAPSCSACRTSARIFAISAAVDGRAASSPMTWRRTVPCPTISIAFTPMPCFSSNARCSATGHGERPSWLTTTVVMPCDTRLGAERRSRLWSRKPPRGLEPSSAWEWMSMKPGATNLPVASTTVVAEALARRPTAAMRPSFTATSAGNQGLPGRPGRVRSG
jgi:hypothetical protein